KKLDLIKTWLGDLRRKLTNTADPAKLHQTVNLKPKEAFVLSRIEGILSACQLLNLSGLSEEEALKAICGLLTIGFLEWVEGSVDSSLTPAPKPEFDIQTAAAFCYEVENTLRTMENANLYAVLGLERGAREEEIRRAYAQMAKKFQPEQYSQL